MSQTTETDFISLIREAWDNWYAQILEEDWGITEDIVDDETRLQNSLLMVHIREHPEAFKDADFQSFTDWLVQYH